MKKGIFNVLMIISGFIATACGSPRHCRDKAEGTNVDNTEVAAVVNGIMGDCAPIELSSEEVVFPRNGGEATITCKNYENWWINDVQVVGEDKVTHAEPGADNSYKTLKAEGISAEIVNGNQVRVTVDENAAERSWYLHMESGDAFTTIRIIKKDK